jgi:hypothetical protein
MIALCTDTDPSYPPTLQLPADAHDMEFAAAIPPLLRVARPEMTKALCQMPLNLQRMTANGARPCIALPQA